MPTLPSGVDAVTGANDPWFTMAVTLGAEPNTQAGYDDYDAAHRSFVTGGRHAVTLNNPKLAAAIASGIAAGQNIGRTASDILSDMLLVNDQVADGSQWAGVWLDVSSTTLATYTKAVNQALPVLIGAGDINQAGSAQVAADTNARSVWAAALAAGYITIPSGLQIPKSLIIAGPTELPDGTIYVQYNDPIAAVYGANAKPVVWYNGPNYKPRTTSPNNPIVKTANDDLIQVQDAGTGDWYRCMFVYGDPVACQPPASYTGAYTLPPDVGKSLSNQAGDTGAFVPTPVSVDPGVIPAGSTVNGPTAQPQTGTLTPSGTGSAAPSLAPATTTTTPATSSGGLLTVALLIVGLLFVMILLRRNGAST